MKDNETFYSFNMFSEMPCTNKTLQISNLHLKMSNIVKCCVKQAFKILTTVCSNITNLRTGDTSLRSMLWKYGKISYGSKL